MAEQARAQAPPLAATVFGNWSTGDVIQDMTSTGWHQERARQAHWLVNSLALPA